MGNLIFNPQYLSGFDIGRFFQDMYMNLGQHFYDAFIEKSRYKYLVSGLGNTLLITLFAVIIGIVLGTLVALIRVSHNNDKKKFRFLNTICSIYLTVIRGTPVVVQLLITYYVIYQSADKMVAAVIAFGINSGAYVAEVIRSGIQSVDKGQIEAGRSLGLNQKTTMIKIVFPQALKNVAPAIFNEFISLLKETSVAGYIGVQDLTKGGDVIRSITYDAYTPLLTVAAVYLLIVMILTRCLTLLERRLSASDIR
ncbi:amino acid ABC transporter permease [Faecalispora anaeroviscerum]|uniref:amino acid ABC transporter permease n=1 Tax=Faecalispora anaeroviscerum TaxID=2991836 RepID=UPI0024B9A324|nr:amino acid ABC transporter permease [Faecalispora anaeroviscerum]